ncbi:MAG: hypothetical protein R2810_06425 [Flavobacteriales bacterium]
MLKRRLTVILGLVLVVAGVIVEEQALRHARVPSRNASKRPGRAVDVAVVRNGTVAIWCPSPAGCAPNAACW